MKNMLTITLNGSPHHTSARTIKALLDSLPSLHATLVVELNGQALLRHNHSSTPLHEGDKVEVVALAAGG